jgi:phytoene dehydrogenase-like protein
MRSIANGLVDLARSAGIEFHFNAGVSEILVRNGKATGVMVNGEPIGADYVICNADSTQAYQSLIKGAQPGWKYLNQQPSTSALIFYWGVKGKHPELDLHNILFSANYQAEFDCLDRKEVNEDPTVYIFISSRIVADDAPEGCENWFVMINAPENTGQDWAEIRARARESVCRKIKGMLNIDISPQILFEDYLDPVRIEERTGSFRGSLYGISSNSRMAAFHRHPNKSRWIDRLYFAGGSVHPGGGIPLCLASARIVDTYFKPV